MSNLNNQVKEEVRVVKIEDGEIARFHASKLAACMSRDVLGLGHPHEFRETKEYLVRNYLGLYVVMIMNLAGWFDDVTSAVYEGVPRYMRESVRLRQPCFLIDCITLVFLSPKWANRLREVNYELSEFRLCDAGDAYGDDSGYHRMPGEKVNAFVSDVENRAKQLGGNVPNPDKINLVMDVGEMKNVVYQGACQLLREGEKDPPEVVLSPEAMKQKEKAMHEEAMLPETLDTPYLSTIQKEEREKDLLTGKVEPITLREKFFVANRRNENGLWAKTKFGYGLVNNWVWDKCHIAYKAQQEYRRNRKPFFLETLMTSSLTWLWASGMATILFFLGFGPVGIFFGAIASVIGPVFVVNNLFWIAWFGSYALGTHGLLIILCLWTFLVAMITVSIGVAIKYLRGKVSSDPKEEKQGFASSVGESLDGVWRGIETWLPRFDRYSLTTLRNVVGLMRDIPTLAITLGTFWKVFTFKPHHAEKEADMPLIVVVGKKNVYRVLGLTGKELCSKVVMEGYRFVGQNPSKQWIDLDICALDGISLRAACRDGDVATLVLVHSSLEKKHARKVEPGYKGSIVDCTFNFHERSLEEVPIVSELQAVSGAGVFTDNKDWDKMMGARANRSGFAVAPTRGGLRAARSRDNKARKSMGKHPLQPVFDKEEEDKGKEKEQDLPAAVLLLEQVVKDDSEPKEERQGMREDITNLATKIRDKLAKCWAKTGWKYVILAVISIVALTAVILYLCRRKKLDEVKQGTVLKYDLDPADDILSYRTPDKQWKHYQKDAFNTIARGRQPGEQIVVPVYFRKGGARMIRATVTDDGEAFQAMTHADVLPKKQMKRQIYGKNKNGGMRIFDLDRIDYAVQAEEKLLVVKPKEEKQDYVKMTERPGHSVNILGLYRYDNHRTLETFVDTTDINRKVMGLPEQKKEENQTYTLLTETPVPHVEFKSQPLQEVKQSFHHMNMQKGQYEIYHAHSDNFLAQAPMVPMSTSSGVQSCLIMFDHHDEGNPMFTEGNELILKNCNHLEKPQHFIYDRSGYRKVPDAVDMGLLPLGKHYAHMSQFTNIGVAKEGKQKFWLHGFDPDTRAPFQVKVEGIKEGNRIRFTGVDNKRGMCGTTITLDEDRVVIVGIWITGNTSAQVGTAAAFTPGLIKQLGLGKLPQAF